MPRWLPMVVALYVVPLVAAVLYLVSVGLPGLAAALVVVETGVLGLVVAARRRDP